MHRIIGTTLLALATLACGDDLPEKPPGEDGPPLPCGSGGSDTGCTGGSTAALDSTGGGEAMSTSGSEPGGSSSSDDAPDTVGVPDECDVSSDCGRGFYCVAPFVPEWGPEGKGPNECVIECVAMMDELRWCLDAAACCDPTAVCTDRGYCVPPDGESSGTDGSDTDGGDTDGTSTG